MYCTNHIISDTVVVFVFTDIGGYSMPKSEDGDEVFNVKHYNEKWKDYAGYDTYLKICLYYIPNIIRQ